MLGFLRHLFLPHHTNNQRARIIHHDSLFLVACILFAATLVFSGVKNTYPAVLGSTIDISSQQLLLLTNQARQQAGLSPLSYNAQLAQAASRKAADMFSHNYWAHIDPVTGATPWVFIHNQGYVYTYAGENLARGYPTAEDTMSAWMASPSHRENILSPNYQDIGFAITEGTLTGESNTILIVEMFGGKGSAPLPQTGKLPITTSVLAAGNNAIQNTLIIKNPMIDKVAFAKGITLFLLILFIIIFVLDFILIDRKKISRLVGHNLDHILFLIAILLFVMLVSSGSIF